MTVKRFATLLLMAVVGFGCWASKPPYADPTAYRLNKVNPHAANYPAEDASFHMLMTDGWKMLWVKDVKSAPQSYMQQGGSLKGFAPVAVPSTGYGGNAVGCYARDVMLPAGWSGRRTFIRFESVARAMHLYVNGNLVGYSEDSFTPAEWEITKYLAGGKNRVAVRVYAEGDGAAAEQTDEKVAAGLLRNVELYSLPQVYITDYNLIATVDTADYSTARMDLTVDLSTEVKRAYTVEMELIDITQHPSQTMLRKRRRLERNDWFVSFSQGSNDIGGVIAWSPANPVCYRLVIRLLDGNDSVVHSVVAPVGFRTIEIADNLCILNGNPLQMRGIEWDEPLPQVGMDSVRSVLEAIQKAGFNTVRLSRPASETFYDMCDQMGLMVWDVCGVGLDRSLRDSVSDNEEWEEAFIYRAHNLLRRDRRHACVVAWGLNRAMPWGGCAKQMIKYFEGRDAVRLAAHAGYTRGRVAVADSATSERLAAMAQGRHRMPTLGICHKWPADIDGLWRTIGEYPCLQGAVCGRWEDLSDGDVARFKAVARRMAPPDERPDDEPALVVTVTTPADDGATEVMETGPRRQFFLVRWWHKLKAALSRPLE